MSDRVIIGCTRDVIRIVPNSVKLRISRPVERQVDREKETREEHPRNSDWIRSGDKRNFREFLAISGYLRDTL